jgi:hypothetical protein
MILNKGVNRVGEGVKKPLTPKLLADQWQFQGSFTEQFRWIKKKWGSN